MSRGLAKLELVLEAIDRASGPLRKVQKAIGGVEAAAKVVAAPMKRLDKAFDGVERAARPLGKVEKAIEGIEHAAKGAVAPIERLDHALEKVERAGRQRDGRGRFMRIGQEAEAAVSPINKVHGALRNIDRAGERAGNSLRNFAAIGVGITVAGVVLALRSGVEEAQALQAQLGELGIKGDLGADRLGAISRRLVEVSKQTNQSQSTLAGGLDAVMAAGLSADVAVGGIGLIGKTATASGAEVDDLAKTLSALNQNLDVAPGAEMTKSFEALVQSGNAGAFELKDMATYFPQLTASASALGTKGAAGVADLAAALQIARRGAGDASTAANNMSNFLGKLGSKAFIDNFGKMGVDVVKELAYVKKKGISPIEHFIKLIDKKTKGGRVDLLSKLFGDKQVVDFIRPMIADYGDYIKIRDDAERADGIIDRQYQTRMQSADQRMRRFGIAVQNLRIGVGNALLGPLADGADRLAKTLNTLDSRVGVLDRLSTAWKGFSAGAGLGAGSIGEIYDALDKAVFGDASTIEADSDRMGKIFLKFKNAGEDLKAAVTAFKTADGLGPRLEAIGVGIKALSDSIGVGGIVAIGAAAVALSRLGLGLGRFAVGGAALRLFGIALGLTVLAGSGGEMSAIDWATVAVGITSMAGPIWQLATSLRRLAGSSAGAAVLTEVAGASAGVAATGGKGFLGAVAARIATLAVPTALAAGAGWALWKGPQRQPKSEQAGYSARVRTAEQDPLAVNAKMNGLLSQLQSMRALAEGLSKAGPTSVLAQRRGVDLSGRIGGVDAQIASLQGSTATEAGVGKATLDAIVSIRQDIAKLVPQIAPSLQAAGLPNKNITAADVVDQAGISSALAAVSTDAAKTGADVASSLGITVMPMVDTSSITTASRAVEALKSSLAGIGKVSAGAAPALPLDGKRALGGPVNAGGLYLVGERGPELFSPGRNGMIHTAAATRGVVGGERRRRDLFAAAGNDGGGSRPSGGSSAPIDASLHIGTVHYSSPEDKAEFETLLRRHSKTVADVVASETRRARRLEF